MGILIIIAPKDKFSLAVIDNITNYCGIVILDSDLIFISQSYSFSNLRPTGISNARWSDRLAGQKTGNLPVLIARRSKPFRILDRV